MENRINICIFNLLRNDQGDFQSTYTVFHPHQQRMRISEGQQSCQLSIVKLLNFSHFSGYMVLSHCGLNFHFLNKNDVEYLFKHLFIISYFIWWISTQIFYFIVDLLARFIYSGFRRILVSLSTSTKCQPGFWLGSHRVCSGTDYIFTILHFRVHEHRILLHLFKLSLISLCHVFC